MVWELIEKKLKEGELVVIFIFNTSEKIASSSHEKKQTSFQKRKRTENLEKVRRVCKVLKNFSVKDIVATTSLPASTVRDNLAKLIKGGEVKLLRKDGKKKVYMWVGKEVVRK